MTWFKLDDGWLMHPKMRRIGKDGRALWLAGGTHCAQQLTDGRIDKEFVTILALQAEVKPTVARLLVSEGLWVDGGDHYVMHDYLDYQPSRAQVESERGRNRERQAAHRDRRRNAVTNPVSDGVSNTAPTRPDPSTTYLPTQTTDDYELREPSSSSDQQLAKVIELTARSIAVARSHSVTTSESGVLDGIRKNLRTEKVGEIRRLLADGLNAEQVAAHFAGSATAVRAAQNASTNPRGYL